MTAVEQFNHRFIDLLDKGIRVPCSFTTDTDNDWLADDLESQERAALKCFGCPLTSLCHEMAVASRTTFGVWGGQILTKFPKPKKEKAA